MSKFVERLHDTILAVSDRMLKLDSKREPLSADELVSLRRLIDMCGNLIEFDKTVENVSCETELYLIGHRRGT